MKKFKRKIIKVDTETDSYKSTAVHVPMGIMLFFHIGWMKHYQGQDEADMVQGGGSFVKEKGCSGEENNFMNYDGKCYGYAPIKKKLDFKTHFGLSPKDEYIDDITIVFFARNPNGSGMYIVGWYLHARLYRTLQVDDDLLYVTETEYENATLLDVNTRNSIPTVPRANDGKKEDGFGTSPAWYAEGKRGIEYKKVVRDFISTYKLTNTTR